MVEFASLPQGVARKSIAVYAAIVALGGAVGGYAIHEHRSAQNLAAENVQTTAALSATQHQLSDLTAKVNMLASRNETQSAPSASSAQSVTGRRPTATHRQREDPRYKKLQSQIDAQGKAIEQTRNDLASTQGDLSNTRTELSGSIAHTHDELVLLQKKGERNYAEFELSKSKQFRREGPLELRLKKANNKHQYADLELMVDDRNLSQKHVNLYQPVMFYTPDSPQPVEVVINDISKDRIHGYVSAPKYRQSELASMSNAAENATPNPVKGRQTPTSNLRPERSFHCPNRRVLHCWIPHDRACPVLAFSTQGWAGANPLPSSPVRTPASIDARLATHSSSIAPGRDPASEFRVDYRHSGQNPSAGSREVSPVLRRSWMVSGSISKVRSSKALLSAFLAKGLVRLPRPGKTSSDSPASALNYRNISATCVEKYTICGLPVFAFSSGISPQRSWTGREAIGTSFGHPRFILARGAAAQVEIPI